MNLKLKPLLLNWILNPEIETDDNQGKAIEHPILLRSAVLEHILKIFEIVFCIQNINKIRS